LVRPRHLHAAAEAGQKIAAALDEQIGTTQVKPAEPVQVAGKSQSELRRTGANGEHDPKHREGQCEVAKDQPRLWPCRGRSPQSGGSACGS
jgi:hypothetical protein